MFQDSFVLDDTVENNILMGSSAPHERVVAAAEAASIADVIDALPQGYRTVVGADGTRLSGGEAQRLAIARAMLRDTPLIILDEATAYADAENEAKIQDAFAQLAARKTVLVIAHRMKTVRTADLKGPTAMGLVRFMSEAEAGNVADNDYTFDIYASADEVTPLIAQEEVDIAAVPANLASVLYNRTEGGVRVIAINTLGVLYIVEQGDSVQSVADLAGKTICAARRSIPPARVPRPSTASPTSWRRMASPSVRTSRWSGRASTPRPSRSSWRTPTASRCCPSPS